MRFLSKLVPRFIKPAAPVPALEAQLDYQKLEPRRVLSATFAFSGGQLLLDGFDLGQDLTFAQQDETINGTTTNAYIFELASGSWTGSNLNPGIEIESVNGGINNQLQLAISLFGSAENSLISIDGATGTPLNIDVNQLGSSFTTGELDLANISSVDSSLQLRIDGDVTLDNIQVSDSNPNDAVTSPASLSVTATGSIDVQGNLSNQMSDAGAGITLIATGNNSDVHLHGVVETTAGSITIGAGDSVLLGENAAVNSGQAGNVIIIAGNDGVIDDDLSRIEFASGASVDAGSGIAILNTAGGGNILLGNVTSTQSGNAITVISGQNIFDNTSDELANLSAVNGTINLIAGSNIGGLDASTDFFKATSDDFELIELNASDVNVQASQNVGLHELSTTDTTFSVDADTVFLVSQGDLVFQNPGASIVQLALISEQSIILPAAISVTENLRIEATEDVQASDGTIDITAASLLFQSGASQTIRTVVSQLDATVDGDLVVENTGDLDLVDLNCDLVAVISTSNTGLVDIHSSAGLTVSADVIAGALDGIVSSGDINLTAENILIEDVVLADNGNIVVTSNNTIGMGTQGVVSSVGGDVEFQAAGEIQMQDGAHIVVGRDNSTIYAPGVPVVLLGAGNFGGIIELTADQHITLGSIATNNETSNAIGIFSDNGAILDGGDLDVDVISEQPTAIVTMESATGIGANNALETSISQLFASVSNSGDIGINESGAIGLLNISTSDGGISVDAVGDILAIGLETEETEIGEDDADNISLISTGGSIFTTQLLSADGISLSAASGSIADTNGGSLQAEGGGQFVAQDSIELGNSSSNSISIG